MFDATADEMIGHDVLDFVLGIPKGSNGFAPHEHYGPKLQVAMFCQEYSGQTSMEATNI